MNNKKDSEKERDLVLGIAKDVYGVEEVINYINIKPSDL